MWNTCFTVRSTFPEAVSKLLILFQILEFYSTMLKMMTSPEVGPIDLQLQYNKINAGGSMSKLHVSWMLRMTDLS